MSSSSLKPIIVWGSDLAPNPLKVRMILEELSLPYEHKLLDFGDVKGEAFVKINPNGRIPAIEDPNTGLVLWESGPIIEYLVDQYDKDHKISYDGFVEKWQIRQWIGFQISGADRFSLSPPFSRIIIFLWFKTLVFACLL